MLIFILVGNSDIDLAPGMCVILVLCFVGSKSVVSLETWRDPTSKLCLLWGSCYGLVLEFVRAGLEPALL